MSKSLLYHKSQKSQPVCICSTPQPSRWLEGHCLACLKYLNQPNLSRTPSPQPKFLPPSHRQSQYTSRAASSISSQFSQDFYSGLQLRPYTGTPYGIMNRSEEHLVSSVSHTKLRSHKHVHNVSAAHLNVKQAVQDLLRAQKSKSFIQKSGIESLVHKRTQSPYIARSTPKNLRNHQKIHSPHKRTPQIDYSQKIFKIKNTVPIPELRLPPRLSNPIQDLTENSRLEGDFSVKSVYSGHSNSVNAIAVSAGRVWTAGQDYWINCWVTHDQPGHKRTPSLKILPFSSVRGHSRGVTALCVPDVFLVSGSLDSKIKVWNPSKTEYVAQMAFVPGPVTSFAAASPLTLVSGHTSAQIAVWDLEFQRTANLYKEHCGAVKSLVMQEFSTFLSGSADCSIKLWDLRVSRSSVSFKEHSDPVCSVLAWDEHCFFSAGGQSLMVRFRQKWDIRTGGVLQKVVENEEIKQIAQFEGQLLSCGKALKVWTGGSSAVQYFDRSIKSMLSEPPILYLGCYDGSLLALKSKF